MRGTQLTTATVWKGASYLNRNMRPRGGEAHLNNSVLSVEVKVNFNLEQAMKAQRESKV